MCHHTIGIQYDMHGRNPETDTCGDHVQGGGNHPGQPWGSARGGAERRQGRAGRRPALQRKLSRWAEKRRADKGEARRKEMEKNDWCQSCARRARARARWVLGVTLPRCAEVQVGGSVVASQRYAGTAAGMREREGKRGEERRKKEKSRRGA